MKGGDRFIPTRDSNWQTKFATKTENDHTENYEYPYGFVYPRLLQNELLGAGHCDARSALFPQKRNKLFQYSLPNRSENSFGGGAASLDCHSRPSVGAESQKLLRTLRESKRKISPDPFKVLEAPGLEDNFYYNLIDWSSQNVLSVALGCCTYLWPVSSSTVTRLCDLSGNSDSVTSVAWNELGNRIAVGKQSGIVHVWDVNANTRINVMQGHLGRVGCLAWNGDVLTSGSLSGRILQCDVRTPSPIAERKLVGHQLEVCGLKWSPDKQNLASGGNDNRLFVWNMHSLSPTQIYTNHSAAVKAIAWSPHHHGLLASGGGAADQCIRFWNTLTGQPMQYVNTGSQVSNLAWSKHSSELVSTHGDITRHVNVWRYPSLKRLAALTGHSSRVLYMAMSPDGEAVATGGGDQTIRFWNVFSKAFPEKENKSVLNLFSSIR
jgi:cell division cycle 20-like protein 1 (cofactor of APC complex)